MKELDSYLNDHLAGSVSALELIEHWAHLHDGKPLGVFFSQIDTEIRADQNVLRNLIHRLGVEESSLRQAGAWAAEKLGRVRLMIAGGEQGSAGRVRPDGSARTRGSRECVCRVSRGSAAAGEAGRPGA